MKNKILAALNNLPFFLNKKRERLYRNKFTGVIEYERNLGDASHYELYVPDEFLKKISGVIHIGANIGHEINLYDQFSLKVFWVEPIPKIFNVLENNIAPFPLQKAVKNLLSDVDGQDIEFKIANNDGCSSSMLDIAQHADIWPEVHFTESIKLKTLTLNTLVKQQKLEMNDYQALVMDTQGTELLVLKGASEVLRNFKYIKTEAPDFEAYAGCCLVNDLTAFLDGQGFKELSRAKFAERAKGGTYYDVIYERK